MRLPWKSAVAHSASSKDTDTEAAQDRAVLREAERAMQRLLFPTLEQREIECLRGQLQLAWLMAEVAADANIANHTRAAQLATKLEKYKPSEPEPEYII